MTAKSKKVAATYTKAARELHDAFAAVEKQQDSALDKAIAVSARHKLDSEAERRLVVVNEWLRLDGYNIKATKESNPSEYNRTKQARGINVLYLEAAPFIDLARKTVDKYATGHRMDSIKACLRFARSRKKDDGVTVKTMTVMREALKGKAGNGKSGKPGLTGLSKDADKQGWRKHFGDKPTGMKQTAAFAFDKLAALIADEGVADEDRATLKDALDVIVSYNWSKTK